MPPRTRTDRRAAGAHAASLRQGRGASYLLPQQLKPPPHQKAAIARLDRASATVPCRQDSRLSEFVASSSPKQVIAMIERGPEGLGGAGGTKRRLRHAGRGARAVLVVLMASACECFSPALHASRPGGRAACRSGWPRAARARGRRGPAVAASLRAGLPLEIKECKLFKPDGNCDPEQAEAFLSTYWQKQPVLLRQVLEYE